MTLTFPGRTTSTRPSNPSKGPLAIQINSAEPMEIEPSVLTQSDWPKGKSELTLAYTGGSQAQQLVGEASYHICHQTKKTCQAASSQFTLDFKP